MKKKNKEPKEDPRQNFLFTYEDLEKAFKNGSWITSWSDWGYETRWKNFEEWFDNFFKKNYENIEK